jgi:hypothetical protein
MVDGRRKSKARGCMLGFRFWVELELLYIAYFFWLVCISIIDEMALHRTKYTEVGSSHLTP